MNRNSYTLIGYFLLPWVLLRFVCKQRHQKHLSERLGLRHIKPAKLWVHCVSLGEFEGAKTFIDRLVSQYPGELLLTTVTPTGRDAAIAHLGGRAQVFYLPLDLPGCVKRFLRQAKPKLCFLLETELWPNLVHYTHQEKIDIFLLNARLSQKSFKQYQKIAPKLIARTLKKIDLIVTQDDNSFKRFKALGTPEERTYQTANIKFSQSYDPEPNALAQIGAITSKRVALSYVSTHPGEEEQIIKAWQKNPTPEGVLNILIPRHPERFREVCTLLTNLGVDFERRSDDKTCRTSWLVGDTIGEVSSYLSVSKIAYFGGSLVNIGGHNMLAAAALGKPCLFGPHTFAFEQIANELLLAGGAIRVENAKALFQNIKQLLENPNVLQNMGDASVRYVSSKKESVEENLVLLAPYLSKLGD